MKRPYGSMRHLWMVTATSIAFAAGRRLNRPRLLRRCLLREGALPKPHRKTSKPGEESVSRTRELNDFFFFFFFPPPRRASMGMCGPAAQSRGAPPSCTWTSVTALVAAFRGGALGGREPGRC